jgi:hypothetical protein
LVEIYIHDRISSKSWIRKRDKQTARPDLQEALLVDASLPSLALSVAHMLHMLPEKRHEGALYDVSGIPRQNVLFRENRKLES